MDFNTSHTLAKINRAKNVKDVSAYVFVFH